MPIYLILVGHKCLAISWMSTCSVKRRRKRQRQWLLVGWYVHEKFPHRIRFIKSNWSMWRCPYQRSHSHGRRNQKKIYSKWVIRLGMIYSLWCQFIQDTAQAHSFWRRADMRINYWLCRIICFNIFGPRYGLAYPEYRITGQKKNVEFQPERWKRQRTMFFIGFTLESMRVFYNTKYY